MRIGHQQVYLFDTYLVTLLEDIVASPHRHGAYQLLISLDGRPCSMGSNLGSLRSGLLHLARTNEPHAVDGHGGIQAVILIAPESLLARDLAAEYLRDEAIVVLPDAVYGALEVAGLRKAYEDSANADTVRRLADDFFATLSKVTPDVAPPFHPAIRKAARIIHELPQKKISADELCDAVGLSRSHFLRLFKEHLGTPLRAYLLWLRCMDGARMLFEGANVSEAAVMAGFTDSAHFNRAFWRFFAMNPSDVLRVNLHVNITPRLPV